MSSSMEKIKLDYSLKNIPTPDKNTYELLLIEKIEAVEVGKRKHTLPKTK